MSEVPLNVDYRADRFENRVSDFEIGFENGGADCDSTTDKTKRSGLQPAELKSSG